MSNGHSVLVCDNIHEAGVALLRKHIDHVVEAGTLNEDELIGAMAGIHGLIVRSATKVRTPALEAADKLRIIARAGVGVDSIDVDQAAELGILVVNSPMGNVLAAAEHTIAMMMAAARQIAQADASMKQRKFERKQFIGYQLQGKTLGLIGIGNVGAEVARRVHGMGMRIVACDPYVDDDDIREHGAQPMDVGELCDCSDFVSVHVPLTEETVDLVDAECLARLPEHAIVVNTARGGVINERALLQALNDGQIAAAAIDVFENEPDVLWDLATHPKVTATPHLGASTFGAQKRVAVDSAQQVIDVLGGRPPQSPVNAPASR